MDGPPPALPATVRWSSSAPWWTPCVALSKSRTPWSSATRASAGRGRRERVERTRTFGRLPFRQLPARASLTVRLGQSGGRLSWRRHRHARNRLSQTEPGPRRSGGVRDPPADAGEPRTSETMNSALCPTSNPASYPVLAVESASPDLQRTDETVHLAVSGRRPSRASRKPAPISPILRIPDADDKRRRSEQDRIDGNCGIRRRVPGDRSAIRGDERAHHRVKQGID